MVYFVFRPDTVFRSYGLFYFLVWDLIASLYVAIYAATLTFLDHCQMAIFPYQEVFFSKCQLIVSIGCYMPCNRLQLELQPCYKHNLPVFSFICKYTSVQFYIQTSQKTSVQDHHDYDDLYQYFSFYLLEFVLTIILKKNVSR